MKVLHDPPHLRYYKLLEQDLENCFRFVEPCSEHFGVYSEEFSRIILMAAAGIENALKGLAFWAQVKYPDTPTNVSNIQKLFGVVTHLFPNFCTMQLFMPRYSILIEPWQGWSASSAPDWWSNGYNKIKHDRQNHLNAPTLQRAVNAVGALQVVLLHYYRLESKDAAIADRGIPELLIPWDINHPADNASQLWQWELPDDPSSS
jgi:hypothetical protein